MDKELLELLNEARQNGANASQLDGIIAAYNSKKKNTDSSNGSTGSVVSTLPSPAKEKNEAPAAYPNIADVINMDFTPKPVQQLRTFGKLAQVQKKINNGTVNTKDLVDIAEHPEAVPLINNFVKQYSTAPQEGETEIDNAIKNAQLKNRKNYKAEEFAEIQKRRNRFVDILNTYQLENVHVSGGTGGAAVNISHTPLSQLFTPDSYEHLLENIQSATSLVSRDGKSTLDKKELIDLVNQKIADDASLKPVSPEIKSLNKNIQEAAIKWNYKSIENFNPATADNLDAAGAENFENGLEVVKRTDSGKYKNVIRSLRERSDVPQTDFEMIAAIGQEVKNKRLLRESSDNPTLIGKETAIQYMGKSRDSRKAQIAGQIGEYMKSKGRTNESTFSEKDIRDAAKALKVTDAGIVNDLVFEEKLIGYDAIPKSGWIPSLVDRGLVAPLNSIANTLTGLSESPTETYFRTQDPSGTFGAQKVPDASGNMEGKLASDRNNVWYSMLEGAGQMATQVMLTKSIGGAGRGVMGGVVKGAIGKETTAALISAREAARAELFGGTFLSTYMQEYGNNYESALNKTGDVKTARLMGATNAAVAAAFEELLPDAKIFDKAVSGLKSRFVPDFVSLLKKGGDPKLLMKEGVSSFMKAMQGTAEVANIVTQEVLEEVGTQVVQHGVEMAVSPQTAAKVNLGDEVWETVKSTAIQTFLPALFGGSGAAFKSDMNQKQLHDLALNKEATMKQLDRAKVEGDITEHEFNKAVALIDTHRKSLVTAPLETSTGERINREDRLRFAIENTSIAMNQARLDNEKHLSVAQQDDLKSKIKESQDVQAEIFNKKTETSTPQEEGNKGEETKNDQTNVAGDNTTTGGTTEQQVTPDQQTAPTVATPTEGDIVELDSKMGGKNTYTFKEGDWKYKDSRGVWQKLTPKEKEQVEGQFQAQNAPAQTQSEPAEPTVAEPTTNTAQPTTASPAFKDAQVIGKDNLIDLDNVQHDKPETVEAIRKVVNAVTQLNPDSKFVIHNTTESFDEAYKSVGGRGAAGGFFNGNDGSLHLNISHPKVSDNTAFHEGAHAIFQYVLANSETATNNFFDQLQKSLDPIHKESLAKFAGTYNDKGGLTEKDEFVTEFFARVASGKIPLNTTMGQKIKEVLVKFAESIGLNPDRIGLTSDSNVRDFARKVNKAFHEGKELKVASQNNTKGGVKFSRDEGDRRRYNSRAETKYLEDLTQHYRGTLDPRHQFGLGLPSEGLLSSGLPDAPLVLRSSTLRYKEGDTYHNLSISEMSDIFSALQEPIAVFQSKTRGDSKVALLETKRGGKNFVAAIEQSRNGESGVNVINSVYPIDNPSRIASWIKDGLMEWSDKEKTSEWISQGQQSNPAGGNPFKGVANIVNSFENANVVPVRASKLEEDKNDIEKYADKLAAMPAEQRDEVDFYDNYQGHALYVARTIMPKKENSTRFRKVREGDDAPLWDYEYIANVDGEPYGLVKNEDPDDWENDNAYVWSYTKMSDPDRVNEDTMISDNAELIEHIRANANNIKASNLEEDDTPDTNNAGLLQGLSHEATADTRKFFDLKEYSKSRVTDEELNDEADKLIAKGFDIDALIKRIRRGDQPSPTEMVVAIKFKPLLDMQVFDNPSDANIARVEALVDAMDKLGSDEGTRLRLRRKDVANSFLEGGGEATLADFFVREKKAKNGKSLTAKEKEKITREFNEIKKINKQLEKKLAKAQEEASKARAEAALQDRKKYGKKKTKTPEEYAAQRQTVFDRIREKLKNRGTAAEPDVNVKSSIVEPENKPHLADIAEDVNEIFEMLVEENPKRTLGEITDFIHEELKNSVDDITKSDVHDIIAGVYDSSRTKPTKADHVQRMFELKKEFQKESAQFKSKRDAERLRSLKERYKKQIDEVKTQLDSGNFATEKPKAPPLELDREATDLKDRLIELQHQRNLRIAQKEFNSRSGGEKALDRALDIIGTPRTIMASFDFSAVLRQGLIGVAAHPIIASKAFVEMFRQFASPTKFNRWLYELKESPEYRLMHESKLYIADPNEMRLKVREEVFMSRLVEKIPLVGTWGIKGSERAYVAFLNKMRVDVFNQGAEQLRKAGRTFENAPEEFKALATWVNNMTGRGGYGNKKIELMSPVLSAAFFSPRFMAARLNAMGMSDLAMLPVTILSGGKYKGFYGRMPSKVRNMALLDMAKFIGFVGTIVTIAKLASGDDDDDKDKMSVETDVRSTNFGKIRIGDTRFDLWGGFQQYVTLAGQLIAGSTKSGTGRVLPLNGKGFNKTPYELVLSAFRKKLAPIPSLIVTALDRRTVIGEKLLWKWGGETKPKEITLKDVAASNLLPMIVNDVADTWKSGHEAQAVLSGLVAMFGVSMQTYKDK